MISTTQALTNITDLVEPVAQELVPLKDACGRVLAADITATRDQPPFAASAMDGYALRKEDLNSGKPLNVIGESAAGTSFDGRISAGEATRIFTGAVIPDGADFVVMQEDCARDNNLLTVHAEPGQKNHIRPAGGDFKTGETFAAPRILGPSDIALIASMNVAEVPVYRRPVVAILATGDELVMPGETPNDNQIIASNNFGLAALLQNHGAEVRMLPIARDSIDSLVAAFGLCEGADLIVTIGGASVGDHDLVHKATAKLGMETSFYKVAMRPGKPLMAGRLRGTPMVGLPGNPVSSMVCGHIYLLPALRKMIGLGGDARPRELARLTEDMDQNGGREHYMRATIKFEHSQLMVSPADRQDSSLLSVLSQANALLVRPPNDPAKKTGDMVEVIRL